MKSLTMKAKLEEYGIISSSNRPRVSNDTPFSESLFRTLTYCSLWPSSGFSNLNEARNWVQSFDNWYDFKHKHSKIKFVPPANHHADKDAVILQRRKQILQDAKASTLERWGGKIRDCNPVGTVSLNPETLSPESLLKAV